MLPASPMLGAFVTTNARGRPPTPIVPLARVMPPPAQPAPAPAARVKAAPPRPRERRPSELPLRVRDRLVAPLVRIMADTTGLLCRDIVGPRRTADEVKARQIVMWLARRYAKRSLIVIGREMGDRDHTTVLHGCNRVAAVIERIGPPASDTPEAWARHLWVATWPRAKTL